MPTASPRIDRRSSVKNMTRVLCRLNASRILLLFLAAVVALKLSVTKIADAFSKSNLIEVDFDFQSC